jgi:hypothetical protein
MKRVFLMQMDDTGLSNDEESDDMCISLNVIMGISPRQNIAASGPPRRGHSWCLD